MNNLIDRKGFFRVLLLILIAPFLILINRLLNFSHFQKNQKTVAIKVPVNGVYFENEIIIVKGDDYLNVFSSACPHLKCQINKTEGDEIVCPCHGSRFNHQGEVIKGPALHPLKKLDFKKDGNSLIIKLS